MLQFSTGLKQALLTTGDFKGQMDGGFIYIYGAGTSSAVPGPDAEVDTISGSPAYVLLAKISESGGATGLTFDEPVDGVISKASAETWNNSVAENLATGTALFFVHTTEDVADGDFDVSTVALRIVGTVGVVGADMNLISASLVENQVQAITYYNLTF